MREEKSNREIASPPPIPPVDDGETGPNNGNTAENQPQSVIHSKHRDRRDRSAYTKKRYKDNKERLDAGTRKYRKEHPDTIKAIARKSYWKQQLHIPEAELHRLRLLGNRVESLCYGPERKVACLLCGWLGEALRTHVKHCPKNPWTEADIEQLRLSEGRRSLRWTDLYKHHWGFNRTNPLASEKCSNNMSLSLRKSAKFQDWTLKNRKVVADRFAPHRKKNAQIKKKRPIRLEGITNLRGRYLPPRIDKQTVATDKEFREKYALAVSLRLTSAEAAKSIGFRGSKASESMRFRSKRLGLPPLHKWREDGENLTTYLGKFYKYFRTSQRSISAKAISKFNAREPWFTKVAHLWDYIDAEFTQVPTSIEELFSGRPGDAPKGALGRSIIALKSRIVNRAMVARSITIIPRGAKTVAEIKIASIRNPKGGHPLGTRKRTALRNEMCAISELLNWTQKQVADDLQSDKKSAVERIEATYVYFPHHRREIDDDKVRFRNIPASDLRQTYEQHLSELRRILSKKRRQRRRTT